MSYRYTENVNYENFSGGRVIYHNPGFTNFPVRLACEIFLRCLARFNKTKVSIYDPCCGGGYLLTVLGLLHGDRIDHLYGSDVSSKAISLAKKNLRLLSVKGLFHRRNELETLYQSYKKDSHAQAVESAERLLKLVGVDGIGFNVFDRDILAGKVDYPQVDVIIVDVPYGGLVGWSSVESVAINTMLDNVWENLNPDGIVAVSSDKGQKINNPAYMRVEKFQIGKRKIEIMVKKS